MWVHNLSPTLVTIGQFQIRHYGLIFVLGFIIGYFILKRLAKERKIDISAQDIQDILIWVAIGAIVGARVFYVLFYNLSFYAQNPLRTFAVWQGGLSFHGGLIGALFSGWYLAKKKKVDYLKLADMMVIPLALGLALGRIGNFINGELYGRITTLPWGVKFQNIEGFRHPSQLYESGKNFLMFAVLWIIRKKDLPKGFLFFSFISMYGLLRFLIEFVRAPDPQLGFVLGPFTMGQLLTFPMFVIGIIILLKLKKQPKV